MNIFLKFTLFYGFRFGNANLHFLFDLSTTIILKSAYPLKKNVNGSALIFYDAPPLTFIVCHGLYQNLYAIPNARVVVLKLFTRV